MSLLPLDQLRFDLFKNCVNTRFLVEVTPGNTAELELVEAEITGDSLQSKPSPRYESFSLTFRSEASGQLPQRTYRFKQPQIGEFDLFIVPVAAEGRAILYQAVFNRLLPST